MVAQARSIVARQGLGSVKVLTHSGENLAQHIVIESLGLHVIARAVIAIEQEDIAFQAVDGSVPEWGMALGYGEKFYHGCMRDSSKGKYGA